MFMIGPGLLVMISALPGNSSAKLVKVIGGRSMYLGLSTVIWRSALVGKNTSTKAPPRLSELLLGVHHTQYIGVNIRLGISPSCTSFQEGLTATWASQSRFRPVTSACAAANHWVARRYGVLVSSLEMGHLYLLQYSKQRLSYSATVRSLNLKPVPTL